MSEEEKSPEQIKAEIDETDEMISGLDFYCLESAIDVYRSEFQELSDQWDALSNIVRQQMDPKDLLLQLSQILSSLRAAVVAAGIPEDLLTNDKLRGYYKFAIEEEAYRLRKFKTGGPMSYLEDPFKDDKKH